MIAGIAFNSSAGVSWAQESTGVYLLDGNHEHWSMDKAGTWELKDSVLSTTDKPGGNIWSREKYDDFELTIEY